MKKIFIAFSLLFPFVSNASAFSCGATPYCKEMSSCAEARFHLEQCGVSRLDRDNDGIPCENVCGKSGKAKKAKKRKKANTTKSKKKSTTKKYKNKKRTNKRSRK